MANPYTDVRAITARLGQVRPAGPTPGGSLNPASPTRSKESIQLGRAANKFAIQNPQLRAEIERIAGGSSSQKPSGFLGNVLGNPVTKVALKGLEAFALPGRAVVSAARELTDVVDGDAKTKASFGDFGKQVKDSQFGFGRAFKIDTGSKWLDRAIGFVGDVALDPLTYATFGASAGLKGVTGSAKLGNYSNRMTLAAKVLENTGDNVLAAAVARRGRVALRNNPEVLERVGANKFGVYFFGKRVKVGKDGMGIRVPLSGTIGEIGESTLSRARLGITNTRMGKYMQKMTMPKDFLDMRLGVSRGTLNSEDAADALKLFQVVPNQRLARASAQQTLEQQLMGVLKSEEPNIEAYRNSVYKFIEDPTRLAVASEAEKRAYAVWKGFLDQQFDNVSSAWKNVDEAAEIGKTENYFPRVRSDEAQRYMDSNASFAADIRGIYMDDPFALPGAFTPRSLREGKKWFGVPLKKEDLTTEKLNQLARTNGGIDFDFFETDVVDVMRKYISDTADELGIIQRNADLKETGFFRRIEEQRIRQLEVDEDDVASARAFLDEQNNMMVGVEQDFRKSITNLIDNVRAEQVRVSQGLATGERLAQDMSKYLYDMVDDVTRKSEFIAGMKENLSRLWGKESEIPMYALSDDFPVMLRPVLGQYDQMVKDLDDFNKIIQELQEQAMKADYDVLAAKEALRQIEEGGNAAHVAMKEAQESIRSAMEMANVIEGGWDSVVLGRSPRAGGTAAQKVLRDMSDILGVRRTATGKKSQVARAKALGSEGKLKDFLRGKVEPGSKESRAYDFYMSQWSKVAGQGQAGLKPSAVSEMTEDKFFNIILNSSSPDINLVDLRVASLYALGRDIKLYNAESIDELPKFVRSFHETLNRNLELAAWDESGRVARSNATKTLDQEIDAINARWGAMYEEATYMRDTLGDYFDVIKFVEDDIAKQLGNDWESLPFDESIAPALEEAIGGARLPFLYDDYIDGAEELFGRQATLGDVVSHLKERHETMRVAYEDVPVEIDPDSARKIANLEQNRQEQIDSFGEEYANNEEFLTDFVRERARIKRDAETTREDLIKKYEAEIAAAKSRSKASSRPGFEFRPSEARKMRATDTTKETLTRSLVEYQAVSDSVQKFEAIAGYLAPHGLVPTENMWRGIMKTVADQYGSQYGDKVRRIQSAETKFTEFYTDYTKKLQEMKRLPKEEQIPVSRLFKESLENLMSGPDSEIMSELFGPTMSRLVDKGDMFADVRSINSAIRNAPNENVRNAAKARLDRYVKTYVIPWAKELDPTIRADKGPALRLLKNSVAGEGTGLKTASKAVLAEIRTPLSRDASEIDIYRWFNSMMKTVDPKTGDTISPGIMAQRREKYRTSELFFNRMRDGYLDVEQFFKTLDGSQHTPSSYALQMLELANRLDGPSNVIFQKRMELQSAVDELQLIADEKGLSTSQKAQLSRAQNQLNQLDKLGSSYMGIYKSGDKAVASIVKEADEAELVARTAREMTDAYKNPDLTLDELKTIGFTKQMIAEREEVLALERFDASLDYAKAIQDQEMVSFLDSVSGVNFAEFNDGIVIGTEQIEKFADDFIPETAGSVQAQVEVLQKQLDEVDRFEAESRARVVQPYTVQRNGKTTWQSAEHRRAAQMKLDQWATNEQGRFRAERTRLQGLIDTAEERTIASTRESLGFEFVPVFAKMPDGSAIKFTQDEWDSLFTPPYGQKDLNLIVDEINDIKAKRKTAQGLLNKAIESSQRSSWDPAKRRYVRELEKRIAKLDIEIKKPEAEFNRSMPGVRNAALEKTRILIKQMQEATPQDAGVSWMKQWENAAEQAATSQRVTNLQARRIWSEGQMVGAYEATENAAGVSWVNALAHRNGNANYTFSYYFDKIVKSDSNVMRTPSSWTDVDKGMQERRNLLQIMWRSNKSHSVLEQREELVRAAALTAYDDFDKYARMSQRAAVQARKIADESRFVVNDVQESFRKSISEIRNAELQAAKAAGAEFDTKTPFWSTNTEVNYTLNGKVYSVPSISDMLADPAKYVKRSRTRGDLFFDLKKPGNVVMFNEANEATRATIALFGMQNVLMRESADMFEAGIVNPSIARSSEAYVTMAKWAEEATTLADNIKTVRAAVSRERESLDLNVYMRERELEGVKLDMFEFAAELRATLGDFNPSVELSQDGMMRMETLISNLRKRSALLEGIAQDMPSKADTAALNASKKPATRAKWMKLHLDQINSNRQLLRSLAMAELADGGEAKIWNSLLEASAAETRFMLHEGRVSRATAALDTAQAGSYVEKVLDPASRKFRDAASKMLEAQGRTFADDFNMPSYSVSAPLNEIMNNLDRINDGAILRELGGFMSSYTGFFKAYATLSPGFHVRNSISNSFQLFAAGAEVKNMKAGLKLWRSLGEHVKSGGTLESWLSSGAVPVGMEAQARIAGEVALALGGGKTDDAFADFVTMGKNLLTDNAATRASRGFGQRVEGSARFMLAFDSAVKGDGFNDAFNRTSRFLVDYNNPTLLDESVRNILPFWTWMSRNLPVQITTQWTNPKPYVVYQRFVNNFSSQDDEQLPPYLKNKNPIQIGKGTFLAPDLPFMAAQETINLAGNPRKALSMVNPGLRVPLELAAGKTFFTGREFGSEPGQQGAMEYSAQNLLPMLGQIDRVTDMSAGSDQLGLARYLGIPVRGMTDEKRNNELQRRLIELQQLQRNTEGA
jgi:hypothetical protein